MRISIETLKRVAIYGAAITSAAGILMYYKIQGICNMSVVYIDNITHAYVCTTSMVQHYKYFYGIL